MGDAVIKYLHGSRTEHERKLTEQRADELLPVVQELTDPTIEHISEVWAVVLKNNQTGRGVILAIRDSRQEAREEANICFSALHEIHMIFPWKIRISKLTLQA